jgi:tripartite-type tricarboxylate transporter receptor subunit TctC
MTGHNTAPILCEPLRRFYNACAFAALVASFTVTAPCWAQSDYPNRPVHLIVPYGPGGVADIAMRIVADKLSGRLSQQFVVENRPGPGGIIAAKAVTMAAADGYTLLMTGNQSAISSSLFKSLPYNILTDFSSISTACFFDLLIVTSRESPLRSVQDIVDAAHANPGKLNIGTINPGSTQHLSAELFKSLAGIDVIVIPFRTSNEMAMATLRGDVDAAFEFYAAVQGLIGEKKLLALASTGLKRTTYLPDVPTVGESRIKTYEVSSWNGISAPAGTPRPVIEALAKAINEVLQLPDVQKRGRTLGLEMRGSGPEEMTARMKADIVKWAAVIEKAGIPKQD